MHERINCRESYLHGFAMSSFSNLWLLVATAAGVIFVCNVIINLAKKFLLARRLARSFPSPPKEWLPGYPNRVKKVDGTTLRFNVRCAAEFKTCYVIRRQPTACNLILCHPDTIRVIQSSNAPKPPTYEFIKPLIGDGLIAANGNKWFRMRRLLTSAFHFEILRSYVRIFQDSTNVLLDKWSSEESGQVELFHHVSLMTLDSLFKCALSYKSNCQTQEKNNPYIKAVRGASREILNRLTNPLLLLDIIYWLTPGARQFYKDCALTKSKAVEVTKERKAALQDSVEQEELRKKKYLDFLDILLAARDESGNSLSEEEITSEVMTFMFAGHDTTASSISWILYNLARYPEHQEKCREEINEVFGDNEEFEWNDLGKLKYVQLCIKESNRLFPPVPRIARLLEKPYEINGTIVPEGTRVSTHIFALHHNPHVWEDAEKYDPLRFTSENMKKMSPYAYIPFSAGPRNCIGQSFALAEIKTAVAMILRKFELSVAPQNIVQEKDLQPHLILRAQNGILVNITPRT